MLPVRESFESFEEPIDQTSRARLALLAPGLRGLTCSIHLCDDTCLCLSFYRESRYGPCTDRARSRAEQSRNAMRAVESRPRQASPSTPSSRRRAPGPLDALHPISSHLHTSTVLRHDGVSSFSGFPPCLSPSRRRSLTSHGRLPSTALPILLALLPCHPLIHPIQTTGAAAASAHCLAAGAHGRVSLLAPVPRSPQPPFFAPQTHMRGCARVTKPGNQSIVLPLSTVLGEIYRC